VPRIYLDNAATSWPKPEAVYRAVDDYQRRLGAPAGRGSYTEANEVGRLALSCRRRIANLIGVEGPERIIFTHNGTDSLNLALHGLLKPGDHVVTTVCEHNSILRPLRFLAETQKVSTTYVPCDGQGFIDPDDIRRAITPKTRLIAMLHASNVTGAIQPAEEIGRIAAQNDLIFLLDAAQSLGYIPVNVAKIGCQLLAAPGHKGLLGPLGTGLLYIAPGLEGRLLPTRQGGTGTKSGEESPPAELPDRYEAGNLNMAGIAGLDAGVDYIASHLDADLSQMRSLTQRLLDGLRDLKGIELYGPPSVDRRVGVVSLNLAGYDPQEAAALLDSNWSIQTRAGLHCAPRMHGALATLPSGTLRLSIGHFSTPADIDAAFQVLREMQLS
jgi:cysteine desulfurase family protein